MTSELLVIEENDISTAWARTFLKLNERGVQEITPLVVTVSISEDPAPEDANIRNALNDCISNLKASDNDNLKKLHCVHTVANTIFPKSLWNPNADNDSELLYRRFDAVWPRIKKCSQNRLGSYFRRMTAFQPKDSDESLNQLTHIADIYQAGNHRRSALQAAIFDPTRDHTNRRLLGFPCLHQISFAPVGETGMSITGYYATQYVFDRAYGNYLGLCHLGEFMAKQLGLHLVRMTCVASIAQRGTPSKGDLSSLVTIIKPLIGSAEEMSE